MSSVSFPTGASVGRYQIRSAIGRGGMGEVYRAFDPTLQRHVALKILAADFVDRPDRVQRFIQEARSASALSHPNIVTVHEIGEAVIDGRPLHYIAMELLEGLTLRDEIHERRAPLRRLLDLLMQVAEGLTKAHAAGIIHRDLKPDNIMVTSEGYAKIVDFGLAKLVAEPRVPLTIDTPASTGQKTAERAVLGTVGYMSPEQVNARPADHRSDIFSFGCMLYEVATRRRPFEGDSDADTLHKIVHEEPPAPPADVALELRRIIARCLAKRPDERYQSITDVALELRYVAGKRPRSRRRAWLAAAAAVVAVVISVPLAIRKSTTPPPQAATSGVSIAILPFTVRGTAEIAYLGEGMVELLSTRLDGVGDLRMVDPPALLAFLKRQKLASRDPAAGTAVAKHFGATQFVLGSIVAAGSSLRATGSLYDSDGRLRTTAEAAVPEEKELSRLVDQLAMQVMAHQRLAAGNQMVSAVAQNTTSFDALKAYLHGEKELFAGHNEAAEPHFQKAVEYDSAFTLAWYRLGYAQVWSNQARKGLESNARALQLSDRLPERERRLLQAWSAFLRGDSLQVESLLRTATRMYPDDFEAWWLLGDARWHMNSTHGRLATEAREPLERVLQLEPEHPGALLHLFEVAELQRDRSRMAWACQRYLTLHGKSDVASLMRVLCEYSSTPEQAITKAIRSGDPGPLLPAALIQRDSRSVERLLQAFERHPNTKNSPIESGYIAAGEGRLRAAREAFARAEVAWTETALVWRSFLWATSFVPAQRVELEELRDKLTRFPPEPPATYADSLGSNLQTRFRLFALGLVSARLGDADHARRFASELAALPPMEAIHGSLAADLVQTLEAAAANAAGDPAGALRHIAAAPLARVPMREHRFINAVMHFLRAELLERNGQLEEALGWYESLTLSGGRGFAYSGIAHYRAARILEQLGRPAEAARHYAKFAEIWRECDPELRPLLDDAQARLAAIGAGPERSLADLKR